MMALITYELALGLRARLKVQARAAEDRRSVVESLPYVAVVAEDPPVALCADCGTTLVVAAEAAAAVTPRRWIPALWEPHGAGIWRKHTRRRCAWIQANDPA